MSRFSFFNKIVDGFRTKRYVGLLSSRLPSDNKNWGAGDYLRAYDISLYLNRAISKRAEKVGEIEFELRNRKGDLIKNDPLVDLFYKPNNIFTGRQFWSLYQKYYDLLGEAYILVERNRAFSELTGKITALHLLRPDLVTPVYNSENPGTVKEYKYQSANETISYPAESVIFIHNPNPQSPLRGVSLIKSGILAIQTEDQISTYHASVLKNGGKVEGVFKFKTSLTENQLKEVKAKYKDNYSDAKKSGMPLFLGGDADYIRTGMTPTELSFLEAKKTTLEDICILTGVPKAILGAFDDIQYSNAETSSRIFLRETIKPLLVTLTTALDERLVPDDRLLTFVDPTPANKEEQLKETESGIKNYYMTINEARNQHGLEPVKNGDTILAPFNLMPLGTEKDTSTAKDIRGKGIGDNPNKDPEMRRMWERIQIRRMDAQEKVFVSNLKRYFKDQAERLIDQLAPTKTRNFKKKGLLDEILSIEVEAKIGKLMFLPVLTEMLQKAGVDAMEYAGSNYDFNISSDIGGWLDKKAEVFMRRINETTFETLKEQFAESFSAGESRDKLIKRVKDTYGDISDARANTIARTEVHATMQNGTMEGYKQAGLTTKIWVAVMDSATRDSHASLDGEERPINMAFSNGLMFPGDPNGPAEEVINCRCVV